MNDKEKLEAKLKGINELKQQYYMGTQEAKEYLDSFSIIDENPLSVVNTVNQELFNPTYSATPERVVGVMEVIRHAKTVFITDTITPNEASNILLKVSSAIMADEYPEEPFNKYVDKEPLKASDNIKTIATGNHCYVFQPTENHNRLLTDIFKHANRFKVNTDEGMLEATASYVHRQLSELRKFSEDKDLFDIDYKIWQDQLIQECKEKDLFSKKTFKERQKGFLVDRIFVKGLNFYRVLNRLCNDNVSNRFEYRRQIATIVATEFPNWQNIEAYDKRISNLEL